MVKRRSVRKSSRKNLRRSASKVCKSGNSCPGAWKHTVSFVSFFVLVYYAQMLVGIGGNLWVSSLIIVVLSYLAVKWCPAMDGCC